MKKLTFLLAILMATTLAKGQSYTEFYFDFGWYFQYMQDLAEMKDGNILTCTRLFNADSIGHYSGDYGYCFLKLNREDASIMDSVFMPDNYTSYFLFEPHPTSDGYLFIHQVYDSLTENNLLKIRILHENLYFDDEIIAPLIDTFVLGGGDQFLLEEESFIMISGRDEDDSWVCQRFGFDGTLKDRAVYPKSVHCCQFCTGIKVWNESPKEYVTWGYANGSAGSFYYHILDSLLNIKESIALEHTPGSNIWFGQNYDVVESLDENSYLLATPYEAGYWNSPGYRAGAQITKRDKATHTNMKTVYFPFQEATSGIVAASPYVVDVRQTKEGYIYLAFGDITGMNRFSLVLLDSDLNVLWQQYYLDLELYDMMYRMKVLRDGGVGIVGFNPSATKVFALFVNNDYDTLEEQGIIVRPYTYYPNPAQDELHLHYSPDVTPTQIEFYDLQGRLVKTQRNGLESISLEGLASGTYTMRVMLDGGKVFSDKVVKN